MKKLMTYRALVLACGLLVFGSCASPGERSLRNEAQQNLAEFRDWADTRLDRAGDATADERAAIRREFSNLTSRLAQNLNSLADDSREEFNQLHSRYDTWDERQQAREKAEENFDQFRSWMSEQTDEVGDATEEERAAMKSEFDRRSAEFEKNLDLMSDEAREEYLQMKSQYQERQNKNRESESTSPNRQ